jgi:hypothetical protein
MKKALLTFAAVFILGFLLAFASYQLLIEFSSFPMGLLKGIIGIMLFWVIDRFAIKEIDTIEELKKGNIAYAIFVLGICIIVACAVAYS